MYLFVLSIIQFEISFFIKIHVKVLTKVFYIQIWFKSEAPLFFSHKNHGLHKKNYK